MLDLIQELYLTNRGFVTDDYLSCLDYIDENELPLTYHQYSSGQEIWDSWVVPEKWTVDEAVLKTGAGEVLVDYDDHPLHLISYSDSFQGWVPRDELLDHLHWHPDLDEAIPWHYALNYRPWERDWGFCVPKSLVSKLTDNEYYVSIDTTFEPGEMTVAEHHLTGRGDDTILVVAHLDHTGMANDDLSGIAGGIELMRRLRAHADLTHSYKFLIVQEMLGSAAYLADETTPDEFAYAIFLEMLGNDNRLLLQQTFEGDTRLDQAAQRILRRKNVDHEIAGFRELVGNDELVLEAPGLEIPTISVSRFPYPEYHTHFDDPSILSEDRMDEAVEVALETLLLLDEDFVPIRTFKGLPSLANPKYDLYLHPNTVATNYTGATPGAVDQFRDRVLRYLEGNDSAFEIAERFNLPFAFVRDYLKKCAKVGLVKIEQPDH